MLVWDKFIDRLLFIMLGIFLLGIVFLFIVNGDKLFGNIDFVWIWRLRLLVLICCLEFWVYGES